MTIEKEIQESSRQKKKRIGQKAFFYVYTFGVTVMRRHRNNVTIENSFIENNVG